MATDLTIREQPSLSRRRELEIAIDGIHFRILRSSLTLGVVVLAVAFLANVMVESRIADACKKGVRQETAGERGLGLLLAFVDTVQTPADLADRIAGLPFTGTWPLDALAGWLGNLSPEAVTRLQDDCRAWRTYNVWLSELAPGHRRILAGKRSVEETFTLLESAEERQKFIAAAREIPLRLPHGFLAFAERRQDFLKSISVAAQQLETSRVKFKATLAPQATAAWLVAETPAAITQTFAETGLRVGEGRLTALIRQANDREDANHLIKRLREPDVPDAWRKRYQRVFEQQEALTKLATDPKCATWFYSVTTPPTTDVTVIDAARQTATDILYARRLADVEDRLAAQYGEHSGMGAGMFWLLVVSFVVCMVGITNAMLISVIERFREIATMKCLGALNSFIARLFLLEAAFLGLVGGVLGVLLGSTIGIIRMAIAYGSWVSRYFPWGDMLAMAGIATSCGLVLAILSALYPAIAAARMPPIEAMRVE